MKNKQLYLFSYDLQSFICCDLFAVGICLKLDLSLKKLSSIFWLLKMEPLGGKQVLIDTPQHTTSILLSLAVSVLMSFANTGLH